MIITNIERQKKNRLRFSIFVDEQYAFSINEEIYARFTLHVGQEISEEEREEIENAETASTVKQLALRFRSYRPRSTNEVITFLRKKGFDDRNIQSAIVYLRDSNLLNDEEYARMVCRDKLLLRPIGKQSMMHLLYKKGIDKKIIENILAEQYSVESEKELALKEGERKYKRITSLPVITQKKRLYEHLRRRGYDHSLSMDIASQLVRR